MNQYNELALGELCRPRQWPTLAKTQLSEAGFPVYGANGPIGFHDAYTHEKPTILIGCRGSCGTVHITPPKTYANGNAMALDELDESRVDINFLATFFRWRGFRDVTTGTSQPQIIGENLKRIKVPTPSLPEQRRIAAILDKADALSTKRREALAQLDRLAQSIFVEMFGEPSANPKGWDRKRLAELVIEGDSINYGVVQPGDDVESGVPLVRVGDLIAGQVQHDALKRIAPEVERAYDRSRLKGDEILVSCVGSVGVVALASQRERGFNIARAVARIRVGEEADREFVAAQLGTAAVQRYFTQELRTVSQPTLNIKQISETQMICPPLELQREFASRVRAVQNLRTRLAESASQTKALFESVQHRAFQGAL